MNQANSDINLLLKDLWPYGMVFIRWAVASVFLPGFGHGLLNARFRILFALGFSVCLTPLLQMKGLLPQDPSLSLLGILHEAFIGFFLGSLLALAFGLIELTGSLISHHSSLSNVLMSNAGSDHESSLPGMLLQVCLVTLFFANDMHHLVLQGLLKSYSFFPVLGDLFFDDMGKTIITILSEGFMVALQISSPFLIFGLALFLIIGLLGRLMPQLQVFFIIQPLEIFLGLLILIISLNRILSLYSAFIWDKCSKLFLAG